MSRSVEVWKRSRNANHIADGVKVVIQVLIAAHKVNQHLTAWPDQKINLIQGWIVAKMLHEGYKTVHMRHKGWMANREGVSIFAHIEKL